LLKHGEAVSGLETQLKPSFLLQKDKESWQWSSVWIL
jgi:hypothetical protein